MSHPRTKRRRDAAEGLEDLSFEAAYAEMQAAIALLESGDLSLEEAITAFERGTRLAQHCNTLLDRAQLRVQQLEERDGALFTTDITIETEE